MATRFYFSSTTVSPVSPGLAAWTSATDVDRYIMSPNKDNSALASKAF